MRLWRGWLEEIVAGDDATDGPIGIRVKDQKVIAVFRRIDGLGRAVIKRVIKGFFRGESDSLSLRKVEIFFVSLNTQARLVREIDGAVKTGCSYLS